MSSEKIRCKFSVRDIEPMNRKTIRCKSSVNFLDCCFRWYREGPRPRDGKRLVAV